MKFLIISASLSVLGIALADSSAQCKDLRTVDAVDESTEKECMGTWYTYAGSSRCDNCCLIRKLEQIQPGVVRLTEYLKKPGDSQSATTQFVVKKDADAAIYRINGTNSIFMLGVDCNNYIVSYNKGDNKLHIFTREVKPNQSSLTEANEIVQRCNMKLYKYSAKGCPND